MRLMGYPHVQDGSIIIENGYACVSDDCPCGGGTISCCFDALMADCYTFTLAGVITAFANCPGNLCPQLNVAYPMPWISACTWRTAEIVIGACSNCGDSIKATMQVTTVNGTTCRIQIVISQDEASDACFRYSIIYAKNFTKTTFDPLATFTLDLSSSGGLCNVPATIDVSPC